MQLDVINQVALIVHVAVASPAKPGAQSPPVHVLPASASAQLLGQVVLGCDGALAQMTVLACTQQRKCQQLAHQAVGASPASSAKHGSRTLCAC